MRTKQATPKDIDEYIASFPEDVQQGQGKPGKSGSDTEQEIKKTEKIRDTLLIPSQTIVSITFSCATGTVFKGAGESHNRQSGLMSAAVEQAFSSDVNVRVPFMIALDNIV